jgi:predicted protein tyrosine phosphatase
LRILFVCSRNQWRSPTAEAVFRKHPDWQVKSAGTAAGARRKVTLELLSWADIIFVMEKKHKQRLHEKFGTALNARKVVVLFIPDNYRYMDPELIEILKDSVKPYLPFSGNPPRAAAAVQNNDEEKYND